MALICPNCQARNRSIAKFCIECITSLPTGCPETDFAPAARAAPKTSYLDLVFAPKAKSKAAGAPKAAPVKEAAPSATGVWISIAGLIVALTVGAAGWLVAGAGGWYLYTAGSAQVDPPRADSLGMNAARPGERAPVAERSAVVAPSPDQRADAPEAPPVEQLKETSANLHGDVGAALSAPVARLTRPAAPNLPFHAQGQHVDANAPASPTVPPTGAEAPRAKPSTSHDPSEDCSALHFISAARCMAAQCLKPQFKSHAQCEAVRRRQRLEEEKRNPTAP